MPRTTAIQPSHFGSSAAPERSRAPEASRNSWRPSASGEEVVVPQRLERLDRGRARCPRRASASAKLIMASIAAPVAVMIVPAKSDVAERCRRRPSRRRGARRAGPRRTRRTAPPRSTRDRRAELDRVLVVDVVRRRSSAAPSSASGGSPPTMSDDDQQRRRTRRPSAEPTSPCACQRPSARRYWRRDTTPERAAWDFCVSARRAPAAATGSAGCAHGRAAGSRPAARTSATLNSPTSQPTTPPTSDVEREVRAEHDAGDRDRDEVDEQRRRAGAARSRLAAATIAAVTMRWPLG